MRTSFILTPLLASLATAQTILVFGTNDLPTCAEQCSTLLDAQDVCVPSGGAPVSSQAIYNSCFCQSAYLTTLDTDDSTICDTTCTAQSDRDQIQSWYKSFCDDASASASTAATATSTAAAAATATSTGTGTATTSSTSTATSSSSTSNSEDDVSGTTAWWHVHARWVAMAIVLLVGFIILFIIGVLLKRRRRRQQYRASMAAPVIWGPHQNQHHTGGINYPGAQNSQMEKGKQNVGALPTSNQGPVNYAEKDGKSKGTGRLKKLIGK